MKYAYSFRTFACLYLDAYCATHVQRLQLSDADRTRARTKFHDFLMQLDAPVWLDSNIRRDTEHPLCDLRMLKAFVIAFAVTFL